MSIDMSQFFQVFFDETAEHLTEMERLLLSLDVDAPNPDDLNAIFRAAHSIKGGSGTFGFTDMTGVTHILETLLDRLRKNELALRSEMVDAFLEAGDVLREMLNGHQNNEEVDPQTAVDVCAKLNNLASDHPSAAAQPTSTTASPLPNLLPPEGEGANVKDAGSGLEHVYHIEFTPDQQTLAQIKDIDPLFADLGALGKLEITERPPAKPKKGKKIVPSTWRMTLQTTADEAGIIDIFSYFAQPEQVRIEAESAPQQATAVEEDPGYGFFDDEPATSADNDAGYGFFVDVSTPEAESTAQDGDGYGFFQPITPPTPEAGAPESATPTPGQAEAPHRRATDKASASAQTESASIRVGIDKVDQLINLVGELVITQAMLAQTASEVDPVIYEKLLNGLSQLERNTRDLQESVMSIRMMPISFAFSRFPRVVRDLASTLKKKVELVTVGEGTELDKGLIEKISDPLTHLVRNSLDHGIELPEIRIAAGKPAQGTITLQAAHQGGNVVISVSDDGAGLNREKILAKAKEKGIPVNDASPDSEIWQLIFAPGFSTADVVTDVSGRGVGMDVVKRNILAMGGRVDIESSAGWGSRITIRLPLTLAILDGMSIAVGGQIFIVPLTFITESLQPTEHEVKTIAGAGRVIHVRGEYLPLLALHDVFGIQSKITEPHQGIVVLLEAEGKKAAMLVDELVGQHQVVIKGLETNYRRVPGVSAATIMGDGRVALILDIAALVKMSQQ
ncbi:MAG: chemotaxis protein CheW [Betaproteobacteria bacterium]|nr:chemotaxis protein CheW [Betaproteobacteria bacterium]